MTKQRTIIGAGLLLVIVAGLAAALCRLGPQPKATPTATARAVVTAVVTVTPEPPVYGPTEAPATPTLGTYGSGGLLHGCHVNGVLPDSYCTPGAVDPNVTQDNIQQTICVKGYTAKVRPPVEQTNRIKEERMSAYGDNDSPAHYELDHLVSLELGGAPLDIKNLWPEPYAEPDGARTKDRLENRLHDLVCAGRMTLVDAQLAIAQNWLAAYKQQFGGP